MKIKQNREKIVPNQKCKFLSVNGKMSPKTPHFVCQERPKDFNMDNLSQNRESFGGAQHHCVTYKLQFAESNDKPIYFKGQLKRKAELCIGK